MIKHVLGPDELSDEYDLSYLPKDKVDYVIYWYEHPDYEGSGVLVARLKDNTFMFQYLGHCSCYGPMDEIGSESFKMINVCHDLIDNGEYGGWLVLNKLIEIETKEGRI